ncbi:NUDIX domain-containing protein [Arthrobacter nitrophenolicus]|jgi:ADP-ribose pyrophosphatase YjhB (NUDIX family)|uniref:NUDIX domain-containing protein n=1 Tax=Arthrobacter nitrophenolicus TaxID=683150 RepID=A0A4R5XT36_9MICC|nr:NUDIX domain-containing protein [Arthrobacter nitrophenolicus]TDL33957.1 NUDIX domain-containing protein [Arthrobacter nitrophenolicus]
MSNTVTISGDATAIPHSRTVIAVVVEWRGKLALFKRSQRLDHDQGLWHCITGFMEEGASPNQQAAQELQEETGLRTEDLLGFRQGQNVVVIDSQQLPWMIHTFVAISSTRRMTIDWEHDAYRWTSVGRIKRFANRVSWLDSVLSATGYVSDNASPPQLR